MLLPFVLQEQRKLEYPLFSGCVGRVLDILRDNEVSVRPVGIYNGRIIEFSLVVGCRVLIYWCLADGIDYLLALIKFVYSGAGELAVPVAALIRTDDHPLSGILPLARTFSGLSVSLRDFSSSPARLVSHCLEKGTFVVISSCLFVSRNTCALLPELTFSAS